ncbi:hypothetical protein [Mucilaginibacter lappiensis]|uniref:Uncharacterized protein n=1 Tax=Mucilaginibacter lappiensis TaxID=354630 RepID=A0A1N6UWT4_9SPHI|nr:hypothetical protein [Mucilaginibacter lappiensis]MBB6108973.1 hypothetical protein [Mucilaginibacter lappiensis]MBB6130566.1 hypothetical protein [Mucilaginibacter lappiensis]SIQ70037.1 hypothetical protein SAMN05421821_103207 [Mucilaginibacter lappiensis]
MTNDLMTKKYILKPGKHQFAPGSAAVHSNHNTSDAEAEWYLEKYPHIVSLFAFPASKVETSEKEDEVEVKKAKKTKGVISLTSSSGGEGSL